eukprot:GGOE01036967.1.p1 GENE.GGOE01036967.1~~GGOE01036967.1.p1  ORF type:complete len:305 (+),score=58.70 GGOE01036967.1:19-933(+)
MESFTELKINDVQYFFCVDFKDAKFAFILFDEKMEIWEAHVGVAELLKGITAKGGKNISVDDYVDLLKNALRKQNNEWTHLSVNKQEQELVLTIRVKAGKHTEEGFLVKAADICFKKVAADQRVFHLKDFLTKVTVQDAQLRKNIEAYRRLEQQQADLERQAKEAVELKNKMEAEYLQKFVLLLNEKKRHNRLLEERIALLEEQLAQRTNQLGSTPHSVAREADETRCGLNRESSDEQELFNEFPENEGVFEHLPDAAPGVAEVIEDVSTVGEGLPSLLQMEERSCSRKRRSDSHLCLTQEMLE